MKIAVLSDVHGNLPALQSVLADLDAWGPDRVVVNGDVVNRGPNSAECHTLIHNRILNDGWAMTLGNHEEYTTAWDDARNTLSEAQADMYRSSLWTYEQLSAEAVAHLKSLPTSYELTVHNTKIRWNHASPRGTQDGIGPWNSDQEIREKMTPAPDIFFTAHTHRMFVRQVDQTQVVNSGSVGVPLDGDKRTGYIQMTWDGDWSIEQVRLDYDREQAQRNFDAANYNVVCGSTAILLYLEWRDAVSYVPNFGRNYGPLISSGELTPKQAIAQFLAAHNLS